MFVGVNFDALAHASDIRTYMPCHNMPCMTQKQVHCTPHYIDIIVHQCHPVYICIYVFILTYTKQATQKDILLLAYIL